MDKYLYSLGQVVVLITSKVAVLEDLQDDHDASTRDEDDDLLSGIRIRNQVEEGEIIGRSEYANGAPPSYLVRYRGGDGRHSENWLSEDALITREEIEAHFEPAVPATDA